MRSWWNARKRELPEDMQEEYVPTDDRFVKKKKDEIMDTLSVISSKWGMPSSNFTMSFEYSKEEGWKSKIVQEKVPGGGGGGGGCTFSEHGCGCTSRIV